MLIPTGASAALIAATTASSRSRSAGISSVLARYTVELGVRPQPCCREPGIVGASLGSSSRAPCRWREAGGT